MAAAGGGSIALEDPPSTDDVQGTGIFGYEKRRISNPNFRNEPIVETSVRKTSVGTLPAAKKIKTAAGKGLKGKKVCISISYERENHQKLGNRIHP